MERQVIMGIAQRTSEIISDNYFDSRPEGSKLEFLIKVRLFLLVDIWKKI
jgi:pyridoxamine 5'-phosphate oxidase